MKNKCVLPFISTDYNAQSPCCALTDFKENNFEELVNDHKNDKRSRFCTECWKEEDEGVISRRQYYNNQYAEYMEQTDIQTRLSIIPVGNVCNLYCVTCSPSGSTSWWKKYNSMYPGKKYYEEYLNSTVRNTIDKTQLSKIENLKHVEFIGGETLKSAELWNYLSRMDKSSSFSLQTNGTVELRQDQVNLMNSFKNFNICFSLDGHERIFDYLRQPAKWQDVVENVRKYIKYFGLSKLSTTLTISNLNIFYIDNIMINLFKLLPSKIVLNFVHHPFEFSYNNLTQHIGTRVEKNNPAFFKKTKIKWIGDVSSIEKLKENLYAQDKFSGLNLKDNLTEFYYLLEEKTPN